MIYKTNDFSDNWYSKYLLNCSSTFKLKDNNSFFIYPSSFTKENLYYTTLILTMQAKPPFYYKLNKFNSYCILYTPNGHGELSYKNKTYVIEPNTVLFIDCNCSHGIKLHNIKDSELQIIYINGSNIRHFYKIFSENNYFLCKLDILSDIPHILQKLFKYREHISKYSEFIMSNLITTLLTSLLLNKERDENNIGNAPKYILDIKSLLDYNYNHSYSLDELSKQYNVSKYKIVRDFTAYLSISPINYLINRRIDVAKKLLLTTTLSIYEISDSIGIENTNHFINLFRKSTGFTPLNYRKLYSSDISNHL